MQLSFLLRAWREGLAERVSDLHSGRTKCQPSSLLRKTPATPQCLGNAGRPSRPSRTSSAKPRPVKRPSSPAAWPLISGKQAKHLDARALQATLQPARDSAALSVLCCCNCSARPCLHSSIPSAVRSANGRPAVAGLRAHRLSDHPIREPRRSSGLTQRAPTEAGGHAENAPQLTCDTSCNVPQRRCLQTPERSLAHHGQHGHLHCLRLAASPPLISRSIRDSPQLPHHCEETVVGPVSSLRLQWPGLHGHI